MTTIRSETYPNSFGTELSRVGSSPAEWQRSKSHMHGSSVELLNAKLLHASSTASSGYWEDYESIGTSAHELLDGSHPSFSGPHRLNRSCATVFFNRSCPITQDAHIQADPDVDEWPFEKPQLKHQLYHRNTFPSFDDEDDRLQSPESVLLKIPAPTIPLNLSTELLQSPSQSTFDLTAIVAHGPYSSHCEHPLVNQVLPRQHSALTQAQSFPDTSIDKKPSSNVRTRRTWCSRFDASDSDEEEFGSAGERPEPRTLFEAALRRARLADSQREVNLNIASKSGRCMPEWGSPIQVNRRGATADEPQITKDQEVTFHNDESNKSTNPPLAEMDNATFDDKIKPTSICSYLTTHEWTREESPAQIVPPRTMDWCTGIENWLNNRPRWLYQTKSDSNKYTLKLCYLTESMENMCSNEIDYRPISDETSIHETGTLDLIENHQQTDLTSELSTRSNKESLRGQLFRNLYEPDEVKSRLEKAEQYCDLYFKQRVQDCTNSSFEKKLVHLQERFKRTHQDVHFSLSQAFRIAQVQMELEKPVWLPISLNVAHMLRIAVKPRNILPVSTLKKLNCFQLQLIVNDIHNVIQDLNGILMESLMERDELHLEHGAKLTELDDLVSHLKELCIRVSIRHYRKQLSLTDSEDKLTSNLAPKSTHATVSQNQHPSGNHTERRRATIHPNPSWISQPCARLTLKQRIVNAFTRQNPTTC